MISLVHAQFQNLEELNIAFNKTAYTSNGTADDLIFPVQVSNFEFLFANDEPQWIVVDLFRRYMIGKVYVNGYWKGKQVKRMHILLLNDFNNQTRQPHPSLHTKCWTKKEVRGGSFFKISEVCERLKTKTWHNNPYNYHHKYVSFWVSEETSFLLYVIEVYPTKSLLQGDIENYIKVSDSKVETTGLEVGSPKRREDKTNENWFQIDLEKPYVIDKVHLEMLIPVETTLKVVLKNEKSESSCSEETYEQEKGKRYVYISLSRSFSCPGMKTYKSIQVFTKRVFGMSLFLLNLFVYPYSGFKDGENVALKKTVYQSSSVGNDFNKFYVKNVVDGNFDSYITIPYNQSSQLWIVVDLARKYIVSKIKIKISGIIPKVSLINNFKPYIPVNSPDYDQCYFHKNHTTSSHLFTPLCFMEHKFTYQYVVVTNDKKSFLILYEIEVYPEESCIVGFFGDYCDLECHCSDNEPCFIETGDCKHSCERGWYGRACNQPFPYYENVALFQPAYQGASQDYNDAENAVDNNNFLTCSHSIKSTNAKLNWWYVDLGRTFLVEKVFLIAHLNGTLNLELVKNIKKFLKRSEIATNVYKCSKIVNTNGSNICLENPKIRYVCIYSHDAKVLTVCDIKVTAHKDEERSKNVLTKGQTKQSTKLFNENGNEYIWISQGQRDVWWLVDMHNHYFIDHFSFIIEIKNHKISDLLYLAVTNEGKDVQKPRNESICWKSNVPKLYNETINCLRAQTSPHRYVILWCSKGFNVTLYYLYAYPKENCRTGFYSYDCLQECNCKNQRQCDQKTGSCMYGCEEGWFGAACNQKYHEVY